MLSMSIFRYAAACRFVKTAIEAERKEMGLSLKLRDKRVDRGVRTLRLIG
jgi:hypothetical protein